MLFSIKFANNAHRIWSQLVVAAVVGPKVGNNANYFLCSGICCYQSNTSSKTFAAKDELIQLIIYLSVLLAFKQDVIKWIVKWQLHCVYVNTNRIESFVWCANDAMTSIFPATTIKQTRKKNSPWEWWITSILNNWVTGFSSLVINELSTPETIYKSFRIIQMRTFLLRLFFHVVCRFECISLSFVYHCHEEFQNETNQTSEKERQGQRQRQILKHYSNNFRCSPLPRSRHSLPIR